MDKENGKADQNGDSPSIKIWLAIIPALVAIIVALFNFPPFQRIFDPTPTPTVMPVVSPTFFTDTSFLLTAPPVITDTPELSSATPIVISTDVPPPTATENPSEPIGLSVRLTADKTSGKAPLTVRFDARGSFLRAPDGTIYPCRGGSCNYTWDVYKAGQKIGKPTENATGTFQYTFGKRGAYFVTVYVCRGHASSDCMGSSIPIEAK